MSDRKKPAAAFWVTVVVVALLVGYPLSIGPACWISSRIGTVGAARTVSRSYKPVTWCLETTHSMTLLNGVQRYSRLLAADGWGWGWTPWMKTGEAVWGGRDMLVKDLR